MVVDVTFNDTSKRKHEPMDTKFERYCNGNYSLLIDEFNVFIDLINHR